VVVEEPTLDWDLLVFFFFFWVTSLVLQTLNPGKHKHLMQCLLDFMDIFIAPKKNPK
jgi:hypothetical protein